MAEPRHVRSGDLQPMPNMIEARADDHFASSLRDCLEAGGAHYCVASDQMVATFGELILFMMSLHGNGLMVRLTPLGAREVGHTMIRLADEADARLAALAAAALAKGKRA